MEPKTRYWARLVWETIRDIISKLGGLLLHEVAIAADDATTTVFAHNMSVYSGFTMDFNCTEDDTNNAEHGIYRCVFGGTTAVTDSTTSIKSGDPHASISSSVSAGVCTTTVYCTSTGNDRKFRYILHPALR